MKRLHDIVGECSRDCILGDGWYVLVDRYGDAFTVWTGSPVWGRLERKRPFDNKEARWARKQIKKEKERLSKEIDKKVRKSIRSLIRAFKRGGKIGGAPLHVEDLSAVLKVTTFSNKKINLQKA